jgi:hypothetical protein
MVVVGKGSNVPVGRLVVRQGFQVPVIVVDQGFWVPIHRVIFIGQGFRIPIRGVVVIEPGFPVPVRRVVGVECRHDKSLVLKSSAARYEKLID